MESAENFKVLTKAQMEKLNKPDLQVYTTKLTSAYTNLYDTLFNIETGIIPRMESQLVMATKVNELLMKKLTNIERTSIGNAQYARKESVEFQGFHSVIPINEIESNVVNVLNAVKEEDDPLFTAADIHCGCG